MRRVNFSTTSHALSEAIAFVKEWLLVFAMSVGIIGYFVVNATLHVPQERHELAEAVTGLLPVLLFVMLFLDFSKINPRELLPKPWIAWSLACQIVVAVVMIGLVRWDVLPLWMEGIWEGIACCMLVPTATAVAVMTSRLGGNGASATTFAVLSSFSSAIAVPLLLPSIAENGEGLAISRLFVRIFLRVIPVIILPLLLSFAIRRYLPKAHALTASFAKDKAFYLWAACVVVNTAQIVRVLFMGLLGLWGTLAYVAAAGLVSFLNFRVGKFIGNHYSDRISAEQSMGQRNTVLSVWMCLTFLDPKSAIFMGAYMLWQNLFNSLQITFPKWR